MVTRLPQAWQSFQEPTTPIRTYQKETYLTQIAAMSKVGTNLTPTSVTFRYQVGHMIFDNIPNVTDILLQAATAVSQFLPSVRQIIKQFIPLRSGKLQDQIFQNSFIQVTYTQNTVKMQLYILPPNDRPRIIQNPAHNGGVGWAYPYNIIHPDLVKPTVIKYTNKGAYYLLDDPTAASDYLPEIQKQSTLLMHTAMMNALAQQTIHLNISLNLKEYVRQSYIGHIQYNPQTLQLFGGQLQGIKPKDTIVNLTPQGQMEYEITVIDLSLGITTTQTFYR